MLLSSSPEVEGHITLHPLEGLIREWMVFNAASISLRRKHGLRNILIRAVIKMLLIFLIYLLSFFFWPSCVTRILVTFFFFFYFLLSPPSHLSLPILILPGEQLRTQDLVLQSGLLAALSTSQSPDCEQVA